MVNIPYIGIVIMTACTNAVIMLWIIYTSFIIHIVSQFQALQNIIENSKSWSLVVKKCTLQVDRVQLYLDRNFTFRCVLQSVLSQKSMYGQFPAKKQV